MASVLVPTKKKEKKPTQKVSPGLQCAMMTDTHAHTHTQAHKLKT